LIDSFGSEKAGWNKFIEVYRFSMYLDEKSELMELWKIIILKVPKYLI